MANLRSFSIIELPKPPPGAEGSSHWVRLAERFRSLRLRSLQIAPEAFASTYEAERQRGLDQTFDRLKNPRARQFIALQHGQTSERFSAGQLDIDDLCGREWVGMIVLLGPMEGAASAKEDPMEKLSGSRTGDETSCESGRDGQIDFSEEFILNGVFVEPSCRDQGVGVALVNTALARAKSIMTTGLAGSFVTVLVNQKNEEARRLYKKCGFEVVGSETYAQAASAVEAGATEKVALKMRLNLN